jgi:rhodanese-related sulfurtransferase
LNILKKISCNPSYITFEEKYSTLQKNKTMGLLDLIFGNNNKKIKEFESRNAILLDVRTKREYNEAAIGGSLNIPLQELHNRVQEVKRLKKPVIVYCLSGVRSGKAAKFLNLNNIETINGGGWKHVKSVLGK